MYCCVARAILHGESTTNKEKILPLRTRRSNSYKQRKTNDKDF